MLTAAENETLTQTGSESPMGAVFRRYWTPALLARELPEPNSGPLRLKLLGEDFIAFRDSDGEIGIVDARCPHRGANLFLAETKSAGYAASTTAGSLTFMATASTFLMLVPRSPPG